MKAERASIARSMLDALSSSLYNYRETKEMAVKDRIGPMHREPPVDPLGTNDPVLAMLGVGRQLWEREPGDKFVARLRSEDLPALPDRSPSESTVNLAEQVWQRILSHQGEQFQTVRGLPLTFEVEGAGIWFFRAGKRVNRKLTRAQFEVALSRCPLTRTTEISDLMDYPYLFAVLGDRRIRGQEW